MALIVADFVEVLGHLEEIEGRGGRAVPNEPILVILGDARDWQLLLVHEHCIARHDINFTNTAVSASREHVLAKLALSRFLTD